MTVARRSTGLALACQLLLTAGVMAQPVDNGREESPALTGPRLPQGSKAAPLFQWDKKDRQAPEFHAWLDNEIDWACILFQRTEEYLAAYERLQELPRQAQTPMFLAFRAECLLERTPPEVDAADKLLADVAADGKVPPYVRYVQARIAHARKEPLKAAALVTQAIREGQTFSLWQRERALAVLVTAAERQGMRVDRQQLTVRLEDPAPDWLRATSVLVREESPKLPVPLLFRLHLAGQGQVADSGTELLLPEARGEILTMKQGPTILAALLAERARQQEGTEPHRALAHYLDLLRILADHRTASDLTAAQIQARFTPPILACVEKLTARKNPERVQRWVTTAVAQVDSAAWWNLVGFAAYNRAAREVTTERVVQHARLALEAFDRAVSKGRQTQPADPLLDIYTANRGGASLLLGMYGPTEERRVWLARAAENAREATRLNPDSEAAWSVLGHAQELLAWRELGIGEGTAYAGALQAFQTQIQKGQPGVDGQANLGRCIAKRAFDGQAGQEQLAQAQQTLQRVVEQAPGHWDATFWLGRIHLERGDLDAAARTFAQALRHEQHGLYNALRLGRLLASRPEDLREILRRVLPAETTQWQAEHALWLVMRSNWQRRENPGDLEQAQPQAIRDAEAALRLTTHPQVRQRALEALAAAQRAAASRPLPVETRRQYRQAAMRTMRDLVRLDPGAPRMWEWGQELAQLLEEDAGNGALPGEQQRKLLNEAVSFVQLALAYAPTEQRRELEQFRTELIQQGAKADPKRQLAEPK